MEEVHPVTIALGVAGRGVSFSAGNARLSEAHSGCIVRVLDKNHFVVEMRGGGKIEVSGKTGLRVGDFVRIVSRPLEGAGTDGRVRGGPVSDAQPPSSRNIVALITAFMPLAFGGKEAHAKLEVYTQEQAKGITRVNKRALFFVFDVKTQHLGRVQWGIHLVSHEMALQVYAEKGATVVLKGMVASVEKALRSRGFSFSAPTGFLKRPFAVPAGYLNVRG